MEPKHMRRLNSLREHKIIVTRRLDKLLPVNWCQENSSDCHLNNRRNTKYGGRLVNGMIVM